MVQKVLLIPPKTRFLLQIELHQLLKVDLLLGIFELPLFFHTQELQVLINYDHQLRQSAMPLQVVFAPLILQNHNQVVIWKNKFHHNP